MDANVPIYIRRRITLTYIFLAIVLIPWIIVLAQDLPTRHVARHWDALWVGFDTILLIAIIVTVYHMVKRTVWIVVSASALATLFLVDVWFDVLTAKPGKEQKQAIFFGIIELILAGLTYRLVFHVFHHATPQKHIKLIAKK